MSDTLPRAGSMRESLARRIFEALEHSIITGRLRPGTRLSAEAIATAFSVSRSPAREALVELERVGLVEQMANRDRRVTIPTETFIADVFDVWTLLESERLCQASCVAGSETHVRLDYLLAQLEVNEAEQEPNQALLTEFHCALQEGCQNRQLHRVADDWYRYVIWFRHLYIDYLAQNSREALAEHRQIVDRFKRRDIAGLIAVMQRHIRHHRDLVLSAWRQANSNAIERAGQVSPDSHRELGASAPTRR